MSFEINDHPSPAIPSDPTDSLAGLVKQTEQMRLLARPLFEPGDKVRVLLDGFKPRQYAELVGLSAASRGIGETIAEAHRFSSGLFQSIKRASDLAQEQLRPVLDATASSVRHIKDSLGSLALLDDVRRQAQTSFFDPLRAPSHFNRRAEQQVDSPRKRSGTMSNPTRSLEAALMGRGLHAVAEEFKRCVANQESDPPAALTAACAGLESLLKHYIHDEALRMPDKPTIKPLWKVVSSSLGLSPGVAGEDQRQILSGLVSVIDGVGALRTHAGSAHGAGRNRVAVEPRQARLAINAAHTLATFVIEDWNARKK